MCTRKNYIYSFYSLCKTEKHFIGSKVFGCALNKRNLCVLMPFSLYMRPFFFLMRLRYRQRMPCHTHIKKTFIYVLNIRNGTCSINLLETIEKDSTELRQLIYSMCAFYVGPNRNIQWKRILHATIKVKKATLPNMSFKFFNNRGICIFYRFFFIKKISVAKMNNK